MAKEIWLNLPVKDLKKSKEFFSKLGFSFHPRHENSEDAAGLIVGEKNFMIMLFPEATFKSFTRNEITDTSLSTEVLLSIDAESREAVDEIVIKAEQAGGIIHSKPEGKGWLYGCVFADLDGHRWNVLYMDMSMMPTH
ncbi:extradiol dioxygenase [Paenibacillus psychroresistens]|uniref:Extradiol dioxygenase n=1 Tax=Paenibacillus psychroresistens TaxID=1778678 RepID=A0A6B8RKF4_9BACL|nr:VOC family protein [Paenibacillus psychroresistens]QGQ96519.1 extradiol dioxygenase [Paenibacillus psychroresistens]